MHSRSQRSAAALSCALGLLGGIGSSASQAADVAAVPQFVAASPQPASDGWIVTVAGNVLAAPRFPGSNRYSIFGYPTVDFRRMGEPARFSAPDEGPSFPLIATPSFQFGPTVRYRAGRYFGDDRKSLFGLRDVKWSLEPGLFAEYWFGDILRARGELRYGVHGYDGFVGNLALDWVQRYGRFTLSAGPRLAFGDTAFTRAYFGVTPIEAALNGRVAPYKPSGGVTSLGALGTVSYAWSEQWATTVFAGYDRLVSDAGRSPIARNLGSRDQFTVGAGLSYSFAIPASTFGFLR